MHSTFALAALPLLAAASPVQQDWTFPGNSQWCNANAGVINSLRGEAGAGQFCQAFLNVATQTSWITKTTFLGGASATVTQYTVSTEYVEATVTANAALTASSLSPNCVPFTNQLLLKERAPGGRRPIAFPGNWGAPAITSGCHCLPIATPVVTETSWSTKQGAVATSTVTSTIIQTVISATVTAPGIINPTAAFNPNGVKSGLLYQLYYSPFDETSATDADPTYFRLDSGNNGINFASGAIQNLNFANDIGGNVQLPGSTFYVPFKALKAQGYFIPPTSGLYTLSTDQAVINNWAFVWLGNKAYRTWNYLNKDYEAYGSRTAAIPVNQSGTITFNGVQGVPIPITYVWINGEMAGASQLAITGPAGTSVTDTTGFFAPACDNSVFF